MLAKSGFEEARVELAQQQGQMVAMAVRRILDRLGLSAKQMKLVATVVPDELRQIATAATILEEP